MSNSKEAAKQRFIDAFPALVDELIGYLKSVGMPDECVEWYKRSFQHNCIGGKLNRGLSVIDTLRILRGGKDQELSSEDYHKAAVLGWCIELLQAYFLVADDIMDDSKTRRGQPCWYRMPSVGMVAINDAFMLEAAIYYLLKSHFRKEAYYVDLFELFQEVTLQTEMGQMVDLLTAPEDNVDLSKFSLDKHSFIVRYKTAYYSFYLPVALAMYVAGVTEEADLQQARDVLIPLGEYFQVQDDYLDCYGDPNVTGKIGTDIQDNKCSWLVNRALQLVTPDQRAVLDTHYGRRTAEDETAVRKVFDELDLQKEYHNYEEQAVQDLRKQIDATDTSRGLHPDVFRVFLDKIYKRQK
ncbi:Farnesyl pyrophosphate synthetase [Savitreella phatthalungensis]